MNKTVYISDMLEKVVVVRQGWGVLGVNECAHEPGKAALPMQIGDKHYTKGLGSHAAGAVAVDLSGQYEGFDAAIGVQKQAWDPGSVVFKVAADGKVVFTSPRMTQLDPPLPVHLSVKGVQELALIADPDDGGITGDCANWAEARLTLAEKPVAIKKSSFDIAPFATVCTWDPARRDGARASRIEEYLADDVYLDQPVKPATNGSYKMPAKGCIGLVWMDQRRPSELAIEFSKNLTPLLHDKVELQAWVGTYPFQGEWKNLKGILSLIGNKLAFEIDYSKTPEFASGFRKVRWVLPGIQSPLMKLTAKQNASLKNLKVFVESERNIKGNARIELLNAYTTKGETFAKWDGGSVCQLDISVPSGLLWSEAAAKPAIRVHLPDSGFAVEFDDLIRDKAIYLTNQGVLISVGDKPANLVEVKKSIATKKTILERVRQMPDQTFAQAMEKTFREDHNYAPLLLALGESNWKWFVEVNGSMNWKPAPEPDTYQMKEGRISELGIIANGERLLPTPRPSFLDGMEPWMPASSYIGKGIKVVGYAAPVGSDNSALVVEMSLDSKEALKVELPFLADRFEKKTVSAVLDGNSLAWRDGDRELGALVLQDGSNYSVVLHDGQAAIEGSGKCEAIVVIPGWFAKPGELKRIANDEPNERKAFADYWHKRLSAGMQFEIPDVFLSTIIKGSIVRCIVDSRNTHEGKHIAPWISEVIYGPLESEANTIVRGMGLLGYEEFAEKSMDYFIGLYNKQGFLTTGYTVLGTGWHLWTLGEFFAHTPDSEWLKGHASEVERVCDWVIAQRRKTMKKDALGNKPIQYGLMTPGVIADWNAFQYYFYSNGMYCMGLETVGQALTAIGRPKGATYYKEAQAYRKDIVAAYRKTQTMAPATKLLNGAYVPGSPSQTHCPGPLGRYYGGDDGNRTWCYDVEIGSHNMIQSRTLPADGIDSKEMADYLEDIMFLEDGWGGYPGAESKADWFNLGGFAKVQPYYARLNEVYAMRDDVKPFIRSYFNALASLVVPSNLTIWEHFDHYGAPDKTHETGVFLQQTRFMLVDERGNELWLAPFVTNNWMKDKMVVSVDNAPTRFGKISYRIESHVGERYILATVDLKARVAPKAIVLRVRHPKGLPIKSVKVDGKSTMRFDNISETVRLMPTDRLINVRIDY